MKKRFKKYLSIFFTAVIMGGIFAGGVWTGRETKQCEICPPKDVDFSLFWEAYNKIQDKFINQNKISNQEIIYGAISGMVETLDDPYTTFLDPQETKKFEEQLSGIYQGVGMEVGIKEGQLKVVAPLEGTPAQRAGLRAGDKILRVNDKSTDDMPIEKAVSLIRGPEGTEVTLTISRSSWESSKDIKVKRAEIEIPALKWEIKQGNIAYINIYQFNRNLLPEFREAAVDILASSADKIVLDLRNNPGGYLSVAQDITGWFLEEGRVVVIEDFGEDKTQKKYYAEGSGKFSNYSTVVLINGGSASAAEILAGALRDQRGVKLVGETSFGKGSIQEAVSLKRSQKKSLLKLTVAKWLTPNGTSISEVGLTPDIKVKATEEDYQQDRDPQLKKAIELLNN